jgi:hypothetical protein
MAIPLRAVEEVQKIQQIIVLSFKEGFKPLKEEEEEQYQEVSFYRPLRRLRASVGAQRSVQRSVQLLPLRIFLIDPMTK